MIYIGSNIERIAEMEAGSERAGSSSLFPKHKPSAHLPYILIGGGLLLFEHGSRHGGCVNTVDPFRTYTRHVIERQYASISTSRRSPVAQRDPGLFGEPLHVPLAHALDIPYHNIERAKVQSRHCVKANVEEDQCPLEECVDGVGCRAS